MKDKIPKSLRTGVVYKFTCAGCAASYVGERMRHLATPRVFEGCSEKCREHCFEIFDSAPMGMRMDLKILHIKRRKPTFNQQVSK